MRKRPESLTTAGLQLKKSVKDHIQKVAASRGVSLTQFFVDGALLLAGIDADFMKQLDELKESTKLSTAQVLMQLVLVYTAEDAALAKSYGRSETIRRAFQFDGQGRLITGNELSDSVYNEVLENAESLKKRLRDASRGYKKEVFISDADAAQISKQIRPVASL